MTYAVSLAERYSGLSYEKLLDRSVERAKECLIDYLGCMYAGLAFESSKIVREFALENYARGKCTVIGSREKLVPGGACLTNSTTGHAAELDDVSNEGGGHPGVIIIPVALAMAEDLGLQGKDALAAIIIGYDVFVKIGKAANFTSLFARGFHPTALFGMFGAAMTAARLMNLNKEQTANALGIVGSFVAGNLECYSDGSFTKRLQPGIASSSGITAAILASKGYTGPKSILEGPRGFFHAYCENAKPEVLDKINGFEIDNISFKPHACCRFNQPAIDAVLEICLKYSVDYTSIKSILVELPKTAYDIVGQPQEVKFNPKNAVDGQFSAPYSVAVACIRRRAFLEEYTEEAIKRPDVTELLRKVTVRHATDLDRFFPESLPTRVTITLDNAHSFVKEIRYPKGDPENPLSWEEMLQKFYSLVRTSTLTQSQKEQIIEMVRNFDEVKNMTDFTELLR